MVSADLVVRALLATVSHIFVQKLEDKYWEEKNVEVQETLRVEVEWRANGRNTVDTLVQDAMDTLSVAYSAMWVARIVEFLETLTDAVVSLETARDADPAVVQNVKCFVGWGEPTVEDLATSKEAVGLRWAVKGVGAGIATVVVEIGEDMHHLAAGIARLQEVYSRYSWLVVSRRRTHSRMEQSEDDYLERFDR